jgi:hypothetical protein
MIYGRPCFLCSRIYVANIIFSKQEKLLYKTKSIMNFKGAAAGSGSHSLKGSSCTQYQQKSAAQGNKSQSSSYESVMVWQSIIIMAQLGGSIPTMLASTHLPPNAIIGVSSSTETTCRLAWHCISIPMTAPWYLTV